METIQQTTPQEQVMNFIMGKITSRCISLAAQFSISDHLSDGPKDAETLAREVDVLPDKLYRVLRLLAAKGIYNELPNRQFENNELSETLRSDHPASLRNFARFFGHEMHNQIYSDMDFSVKTGKPGIMKKHPDMDPFEALSQYEDVQQIFQEAMTDLTNMEVQAIIDAYDFSQYDKILDVGGGFGTLATQIKEQAPNSEVGVMDLPQIIEKANGNLQVDIQTYSGSFLEPLPTTADLILLKRIIHDWKDEDAVKILTNCKKALREGGRILVCDALVTDGPEGMPAKLMDVEMLVANGGRDRTKEEMEELFSKAGLEFSQLITTNAQIWLMEAAIA